MRKVFNKVQCLRPDRRRFLRHFGWAALAATLLPQRLLQAQQVGSVVKGQSVTLFLCGDVMTGRGIDQILPYPSDPQLYERYVSDARDYVALAERQNGPVARPVDFAYIWGDALEELQRRAPDVRIINLETAVTASDSYLPKGINYRMHPANVPCLTALAVDCCMLANNHVLDWGQAGLEETLNTLSGSGIQYAGAGRTLDEARAPVTMTLPDNRRVVVFSYGSETSGIGRGWSATVDRPGVNLLPDLSDTTARSITDQVRRIKQPGDIVVVSIHWGGNWNYPVSRDQRDFAHALIDIADVDVVHGHSSHHVKGIEVYKDRPIIYGCGDFLTDYEGISGNEEYRDDLGLMYFPTLDPESGRLLRLDLTPTRLRNLRVNYASRKEAQWLTDVLNREGKSLGTRVTLNADNRLSLYWNGH
ncbi:MAG: poly-gamma-glutamate biosynthesis protein [Gammaproteobacteria bacterium]|nr:poly-gamma-glutamate biosynthesis protein [Gammaproteobacteria bacterium]